MLSVAAFLRTLASLTRPNITGMTIAPRTATSSTDTRTSASVNPDRRRLPFDPMRERPAVMRMGSNTGGRHDDPINRCSHVGVGASRPLEVAGRECGTRSVDHLFDDGRNVERDAGHGD